jgi:hypothetical protein
VVTRIHTYADNIPHHPFVWQRLGPIRVHLECRRLNHLRLYSRVERRLANTKRPDCRQQRGGENVFAIFHHRLGHRIP